ncbi:MAG: matrixin family metalloprotease [Bryobacteraceae bacterium]|jgi:uncharacterized protein (TIGR03437 family)
MRRTPSRAFRILAVVAVVAGLVTPAEAYYHYVHFLTGAPPYVPVYEKFDLGALPNKTVSVFVSGAAPHTAGNDSFASVLSQVKQAAAAWNAVSASDLRVAFGGLIAPAQTANTPGIEVTFTSDLPPGVLAEAAPTVNVAAKPVVAADGTAFFPIVGSVVMLNSNTSVPPGPSYAETYFTTTIHELGHALGLQHTFTASAMSQAVIRNTTRQRPLDLDDEASLSVLYGKSGWTAAYGSISGKIASNGSGVSLASVVALPSIGSPVSALTNPDGTYRMDGVPPGQYLLYVHPLPPDAGVRSPVDAAGNALAASAPFETVFFPASGAAGSGTRDLGQVVPVTVKAGTDLADQNVTVAARAAVPIYDVVTFSYFDAANQTYSWNGSPVTPAFVNSAQSATGGIGTITFQAASGSTPVPQSATILGGFNTLQVSACCTPAAVVMYWNMPFFAQTGSRHLVLNFANDMYVLPDAVTMTANNPPSIDSVTANGDGSVTVTGGNLGVDTRIFFDGLEAAVSAPFSGKDGTGSIAVVPPPGFDGQTATVTAYNSDGQNSTTLDSVALAYGLPLPNPPATYTYPALGQPHFGVSPSILPAGAFAKVDITTDNLNFTPGLLTAGFGTEDVAVRGLWILSPTHAVANVTVAPNAALGASELSVISGFRTVTLAGGFETQPADPAKPAIASVTNGVPTQATLYPGGYAAVYGVNLAMDGGSSQAFLNDAPMQVTYATAGQIDFLIPSDFPTGPATLRVNNGQNDAPPVIAEIDPPPPVIVAVSFAGGQPVDRDNPAAAGDTLAIRATGLDPAAAADLSRVLVTAGGVDMAVVQIVAADNGAFDVWVSLTGPPIGDQVPLAVWVDGSSSAAVPIPVVQPSKP